MLLQLLQSKTEQIEFKGGREITRNTPKKVETLMKININELQIIGETYVLYYNRCYNIVIFIYQNIEKKLAKFSFEFFLM